MTKSSGRSAVARFVPQGWDASLARLRAPCPKAKGWAGAAGKGRAHGGVGGSGGFRCIDKGRFVFRSVLCVLCLFFPCPAAQGLGLDLGSSSCRRQCAPLSCSFCSPGAEVGPFNQAVDAHPRRLPSAPSRSPRGAPNTPTRPHRGPCPRIPRQGLVWASLRSKSTNVPSALSVSTLSSLRGRGQDRGRTSPSAA